MFTHEEYKDLLNSIERVINQDDGKYIYVHKVLLLYFFMLINVRI